MNVIVDMQFLDAISLHMSKSLFVNVQTSLVILIIMDETTNRTMKPHFIIYILYT